MYRVTSVVLSLVAVVVLGVAVFVIVHDDRPATVADVAVPMPPTVSAPNSSARPSATPSSTAPAGRTVVAFLGDDWTAGAGASSPALRFSTLLARRLGVTERNLGTSGTGYATYKFRVDDAQRADPDVVVVAGGRNAVTDDDIDGAVDGARAFFPALREALPDATIIAVAPMWGDSDAPDALETLATAVRTAVRKAGGHYLGVPDPIRGHPDYMSDDAEPDDDGYAAIAASLAAPLRSQLAAR